MKSKIILFLFCAFSLVACHDSEKQLKVVAQFDFEETEDLKSNDSVFVKDVFSLWNWNIDDSHIMIRTSGADSIVRIFNYPDIQSGEMVFGRVGKAKNEFITHNWCERQDGGFGLYDMMKKKLFLFDIANKEVKWKDSFDLPIDDEYGLALPFTSVCQLNDSLFLMKEDGQTTELDLVNLKTGKILTRYHCDVCPSGERAYPAYDYWFTRVGNAVCIAYCNMDRVEFLNISGDNQFTPICFIGGTQLNEKKKDMTSRPKSFLSVAKSDKGFFCLKSKDGKTFGNEIYAFSLDGDMKKVYRLDKDVNNICMDKQGRLVTYSEKPGGCVFYIYDLK